MVTRDFQSLLKAGGEANVGQMSPTQLTERLKILKEAIRQAEYKRSETQFHATSSKHRSFASYELSDQAKEVLEAEDRLRELLNLDEAGETSKTGDTGCPDNDPCKPKKELNLDLLAEKVFERLLFEVRIERERVGWKI